VLGKRNEKENIKENKIDFKSKMVFEIIY